MSFCLPLTTNDTQRKMTKGTYMIQNICFEDNGPRCINSNSSSQKFRQHFLFHFYFLPCVLTVNHRQNNQLHIGRYEINMGLINLMIMTGIRFLILEKIKSKIKFIVYITKITEFSMFIYIYIYIYIYIFFGPVKPELGVIPSGQEIIHE